MEIINELVDQIGDLFGTSGFSKEKKVWQRHTGIILTRDIYNAHKEEMTFRDRMVYEPSEGIFCTGYSLADIDHSFFTKNPKGRSSFVQEIKNGRVANYTTKMNDLAEKIHLKKPQLA